MYVGDEAQEQRGILALQRPMSHGQIRDMDEWVEIVDQVEKDLDSFEDHPVLITMARFNPRKQTEKLVKEMFERYNVPGLHIAIPSVLSLYSTGRTSGLVVGCGDGVTHCDPIIEGTPLPGAFRVNVAGRECSSMLQHLLRESGSTLGVTSAEMELVRDLKEKFAFVALDYEKSLKDAYRHPRKFDKTYTLPDGQTLTTGDPLFRCMEGIFQPSYFGSQSAGIQHTAFNCMLEADLDVRRELASNVLLSGGSTMARGFGERFEKEFKAVLDENGMSGLNPFFKISQPPERVFSVWIGGSILTSLSTFDSVWVTRESVAEVGLENSTSLFHKQA